MTLSTGVVSRVPLVDLEGAFEAGPRREEAVDAIRRACPTCTSPEDPPRYEPTTSGEWLESMIAKTTNYN